MLEQIERDPLGITDVDIRPPAATFPAELSAPVPLVIFDHADPPPVRRSVRLALIVLAGVLAVAATLAVTAAWGPDAGGLVGVVTVMTATMYGYQSLRGCGVRRR